MTGQGPFRSLVAGAAMLALAGCDMLGLGGSAPPPDLPESPVVTAPPTPKSAAASAYFSQVQQVLLREGMLRTDTGDDVPLTSEVLAENFMRIALYHEYSRGKTGITRGETETTLTRWREPIRVSIRFGASVAQDKQATDRARIASYLARLSRIIGLPVGINEADPNFWIYVVSEDERAALGPSLSALNLDIGSDIVETVTRMPQSTYCNVFGISGASTHHYKYAVAVIRAENPDLLRVSCFHEEIAQAMGLPNDSPRARPSIFNDDEEFALLTDHDELLLRMLYSPELRPGMTPDEARPIVESLARRLTGGES